jgi:predicted ATPase
MKKFLAKTFAKIVYFRNQKWINNPEKTQKKIFEYLIKKGAKTQFGIEHNFGEIRNYEDFKNKVRIRDYEDFKKYIEQIKE